MNDDLEMVQTRKDFAGRRRTEEVVDSIQPRAALNMPVLVPMKVPMGIGL
jgi:hypothetical protein